MALQAFPGCAIVVPVMPDVNTSLPALDSTMLIDASTERIAINCHVPAAGTLHKVHVRIGALAINAASVVRLSFQDPDLSAGSGNPDGTQDQFRDHVGSAFTANTFFSSGILSNDGTDGGTKRAVAVADRLCGVLEFQSFTAGDSLVVSGLAAVATKAAAFGMPAFSMLFTGTWAVLATPRPILVLEYSDGSFHIPDGCFPVSSLTSDTFNSGSTPDEHGLIFQLPWPATLAGAIVRLDLDGDAELVLYDAASAVLATATLDANWRYDTNGFNVRVPFATPVDLAANTTYRLAVKPTSVTSLTTYDFNASSASHLANFQGGSTWKHTDRVNAGAWTDTATKRPWMSLVLSHFDDGLSGGVFSSPTRRALFGR
jgi:hypothetical protein